MKLNNLLEAKALPSNTPAAVRFDFDCNDEKLTSLRFAPKEVGGSFLCHRNLLTSLLYAPEKVGAEFCCSNNDLVSLEHGPIKVGDSYECSMNELTSLKGAPAEIGGDFKCRGNKLTSLEHAPSWIGGGLECNRNKLTSLHNIHKHIKHINYMADFSINPIESHVLGLLKIEGLSYIKFVAFGYSNKVLEAVEKIINKHLKNGRNIFDCQVELEDAGYEEYAQL